MQYRRIDAFDPCNSLYHEKSSSISDETPKKREDDEDEEELDIVYSGEPITFQNCVRKVKEVYEKGNNVLDNMVKLEVIQQYIKQYFENEDTADVFEGFLHLVLYLDGLTTVLAKQHDLSLVKIAMQAYHEFLSTNSQNISQPQQFQDKTLIARALAILTSLKFKHAQIITNIFQLNNASMVEVAVDVLKNILNENDLPKAVSWIAYLNIRDRFDFENIVCRLILENQITALDYFVGEAEYRKKKLVAYIDKLVECQWKRRNGINSLENQLIADKRLSKYAIRYVKKYGFADSEVPNVMDLRAYNALIFHHICWQNGERSWDHFEELALHALSTGSRIRSSYLSHLCRKNFYRKALHFAVLLGLREDQYPVILREYCLQNVSEVEEVKRAAAESCKFKLENQTRETELKCCLDDEGLRPIILADTWERLLEVIEVLRLGGEKVIGIDAEWRPHFLSTSEHISLIQIATSHTVYLVDVLVLDETHSLTEDQWLNFLDALLCTKGVRKIGYDFRNDMRVLKSTFPFISKILPQVSEVICLYRLFSQVVLEPEACAALFNSNPPRNLALSDMTRFFLSIQLQKDERIGNWSHRPLRLEQKKYAALDAYSLVQIFRTIAPKLNKLPNDKLEALQEHALLRFTEENIPKPSLIQMPDVQSIRPKEGEEDFFLKIQKASSDLIGSGCNNVKSIDDFKFVADSMLFGLGKNLRKCGFDTQMMSDRNHIVDFCLENKDFMVLSTGKAHKILEKQLPGRVLFVPATSDGTVTASQLVAHVMKELNILIRPEDIWSRCVECNKRCFVQLPKRVVQTLFYMNAVRHGVEWLEIGDEDLQDCFQSLRDESVLTIRATEEMHSGEQPRESREKLEEEEYYVYEDDIHLVVESKFCAVDVINRLVLDDGQSVPVSIRVGLKLRKDTFSHANVKFFVCVNCGKLQFNEAGNDE